MLGFASIANADSLEIPIRSSNVESSTAVVNSVTEAAHPPLQVKDWDVDGVAPFSSSAFSICDGKDGAFKPSTYLNFHDGTYANDNIIRINTNDHPELCFTEFNLQSPWKIIPHGSKPLIIRSLSTVTIAGDIDCSGDAGEDVDVSTNTVNGGSGRCGGSDGGRGGSSTLNAEDGDKPSTNAFAAEGVAGTSQGDGDAGGGGAGMDATTAPTAGADGGIVAGGGGAAGTSEDDSEFATVGGGAGGGGGAAFTDMSDVPAHSSGAGGGAGGGSIYIYALGNIDISGDVLANGGAGGGSSGLGRGGAGGGGAGGSILVFSGASIVIDGVISAQRGAGGVSTGADGGTGGDGRTWVVDEDSVPTLNGALDPLGLLSNWGEVTYRTGEFRIVSKTFDLGGSKPHLKNISTNANLSSGSSVRVEIATNDSPFSADEAIWKTSSEVLDKDIQRYVRLRITIDNQDEAAPTTVSSVSLEWTPFEQTEFEFSSCGTIKAPVDPRGSGRWVTLLLMLLPIAAALSLRKRRVDYQPIPK